MEIEQIKQLKHPRPTALIYGYDNFIGERELNCFFPINDPGSDDVVIAYFSPTDDNFDLDFYKYEPDLVLCFRPIHEFPKVNKARRSFEVGKLCYELEHISLEHLGNWVYERTIGVNCERNDFHYHSEDAPVVSCFSPAFCTSKDELFRLYNSLKNQTYKQWEWVVLDDSPNDFTGVAEVINEIKLSDARVKYYRVLPVTQGNIGEAKYRAAHLCNGKYLAEVDHDDELATNCLEEVVNAFKTYPDAGFVYSDHIGIRRLSDNPDDYVVYGDISGEPPYGQPANGGAHGYAWHYWGEVDGKRVVCHRYCDINPRTIRYNYTMPNHIRVWERDLYRKIGGHNRLYPMGDDYELIVRTFLHTRMVHIEKPLYFQWDNETNATQYRVLGINKRSRFTRDHYGNRIKARIEELGFEDWDWDHENNCSFGSYQSDHLRYGDGENVLNYTIK